jgi:hypothetical protein
VELGGCASARSMMILSLGSAKLVERSVGGGLRPRPGCDDDDDAAARVAGDIGCGSDDEIQDEVSERMPAL